jgi:protease I
MTRPLSVVVLVADGYQELDFWYPLMRMQEAGYVVKIVGAQADTAIGGSLGYPVIPHAAAADWSDPTDAVLIPGGAAGEAIAQSAELVRLVVDAHDKGAVIGAVGSASVVLDAAGITDSDRVVIGPGTKQLPEYVKTLVERLAAVSTN